MRLSRLLAPIVKRQTHDVTELLVNSGYIRKASSGVYTMLPLGTMVQQRIETIIRRRLMETDAVEMALPALSQAELWHKTQRFDNKEFYKLDDNKFVLAPTNEEDVTSVVAETLVQAPKSLPLRLFQISRKFRNELRPRGGLLRGKEFVMKDLYTFDGSAGDAHRTYQDVQRAYRSIFDDIGVPVSVAEADSGAIGGSLSHEYHYLSDAGEDTVVNCSSCGYTANSEKAVSMGPAVNEGQAQVQFFVSPDHTELIGAYYPPSRDLNLLLLKEQVDIDESCRDPLAAYTQADELSRRMVRVIDPRVGMHCELPEPPVSVSKPSTTTLYEPVVTAQAHEDCVSCGSSQTLQATRAIEVAHTFYLGDKYSSKLKCQQQQQTNVEMGCYGIGVSRMIQAIAEVTRDEEGLKWPTAISPFDAVVVTLDQQLGLDLCGRLAQHGVNAVWDDRSTQMGALLGASRSLGFPLTIIAGKKYKAEGLLEVQRRVHPAKARPDYVHIDNLSSICK